MNESFSYCKEAQSFASELQVQKDNFGTRLLQMPEPLRQEAMKCVERLKPFGAILSEAITFYYYSVTIFAGHGVAEKFLRGSRRRRA